MEIEISLLPVTACICLVISIVEGWIMAFMRYLRIKTLQKLFPGYRYLVRSHVDFLIMATLLFSIFCILSVINVTISKPVIIALIVGALYNPAGFILQAVNPEIADGDSLLIKSATLLGFIPATYGFGSVCLAVICKYI